VWRHFASSPITRVLDRRPSFIPKPAHMIFTGACRRIRAYSADPAGAGSASSQPKARLADYVSWSWPCLRSANLGFVSAKRGLFCSFWGQIAVNLRAKPAEFAAFKKVMSFVFKYSLASFPLFFIFADALLSAVRMNDSVVFCASAAGAAAYDKLSAI